jgi:hypothetical protein
MTAGFVAVVDQLKIGRRYEGPVANDFGIASNPALIATSYSSADSTYRGDESKYFGPVCLFFLGMAAFTAGYWRGIRGHWSICIWAPCIFSAFWVPSLVVFGF